MPEDTNLVLDPSRAKFGPLRGDVEPFLDQDGYSARCLFNGESCAIIDSRLQPASRTHERQVVPDCDQVLFVLDGELQLELGGEEHAVGPKTLVFIPMGTSARFRNDGTEAERHLHVMAPGPAFGRPVSVPVDAPVTVGHPVIRRVEDVENVSPLPTTDGRMLLNVDSGSRYAAFPFLSIAPGGGGPPMHYHDFDMFYFIVDGELTVDFGLDRFVAKAGELVAVPAGAPHTQSNQGEVTESHLAINAPHPGERPWDVRVHLTPEERE